MRILLTLVLLLFVHVDAHAEPYLWGQAKKHPYFGKHKKDWAKLVKLVMKNREMYMASVKPINPRFSLPNFQKKQVQLQRWRGKIILLTRWATWCTPCKDGLRRKRILARKLKTYRILNVGVAHQRFADIAHYHATQPSTSQFAVSLIDTKGITLSILPGSAYPTTAIIDPWGWTWAYVRLRGTWDSKPHEDVFRFVLSLPYAKRSTSQPKRKRSRGRKGERSNSQPTTKPWYALPTKS